MFEKFKRLSHHSVVYITGRVLEKGGAFFLTPVYISQLNTAEYGIFGIATTTYFVLVLLANLVLSAAVTRYYYDYRNDETRLRQYLGTVVIFWFGWNVAFALLVLSFGPILFAALLPQVPFFPYLMLTVLMAFFGTFSEIPLVLFQVRGQPLAVASLNIVSFILTASFSILFVVSFKWGVSGILWGILTANSLMAILYSIILWRNIQLDFYWPYLRQSLLFSLPLIPHLLGTWALNLSDRFILAHFTSLSEIGVYNLAAQLVMVQSMIAGAINTAWAPFYFAEAAQPNGKQVIARFATYFVFALSILALIVSVCAKEFIIILSFFSSDNYLEAHRVIPPLSLGFLGLGLYYVIVNGFFYQKRTGRLFFYTLGSGILNITLNLLTVPHYGIMAAAVNTAVAYAFLAATVYLGLRQVYPLPFELKRIATLIATGALFYLAGQYIDLGGWQWNLSLKMGLILMYPLVLLGLGFFRQDEQRKLMSLIAQALRAGHARLHIC